MANSLISSLLGKSSFSITNTNTFAKVAVGLKVKSLHIKWRSELMRHVFEDGSTKVDARVVKPSHVNIEVFIPDMDTLLQVQAMYAERSAVYRISTRGIIMESMMVDEDQMAQVPDVLSALPVRLSFKEILIQGDMAMLCANSADSSILDRGIATVKSVKSSVNDLYQKTAGLISKATELL